jgi:D-beta-D-heptose 7-phosphate kinase/D-beta-D-heptose 1-phosphate adenosyltransferase
MTDANTMISRFEDVTVLVVGDIILDEFIWGKVSRISPEAPVPVVEVQKETVLLGGAANVVNNILSLGGRSLICGVIGDDESGRKLLGILQDKGISSEGIIVRQDRRTTLKTRVVADRRQQVVRFDRENNEQLDQKLRERLLQFIRPHLGEVDSVILSDYGKGLLSEDLIRGINESAKGEGRMVVVDPKMDNFDYYKDITLITPNKFEAEIASEIKIVDEESLNRAGEKLLDRFRSQAVLITLGEEGMALFERGKQAINIPTSRKEVYDVTGAGDTVVAVITLARAAGASFTEAAKIANYAAGIVVGRRGTATVRPDELKEAINRDR